MASAPRVANLVARLSLAPHPEGGSYREIYRSASTVAPQDGRSPRASMTSIYFLLAAGEHSRWHRVRSDEAWHFYEGEPLELLLLTPDLTRATRIVLGHRDAAPVHVVPAGWWQAARPIGAYALVGCTVAPGFDFADFAFLRDDAAARDALARLHREWEPLT